MLVQPYQTSKIKKRESLREITLFNTKINNITNYLNPRVDKYLLVDDFCITSTSKYIRTAKRQLQQGINKINKWTMINGFKISKTKTQCVIFCHLRKIHNPYIKSGWIRNLSKMYVYVFIQPSTTDRIFKRCKVGLNSEFSF